MSDIINLTLSALIDKIKKKELSSQEIKTLNGVIKSLYEYNKQA